MLCVFSSSSLTHIHSLFFFSFIIRALFLIPYSLFGAVFAVVEFCGCVTMPYTTHYRRGETNGSILFSSFSSSFVRLVVRRFHYYNRNAKDGLQQRRRRKMLAFFLFFCRRLQAVVDLLRHSHANKIASKQCDHVSFRFTWFARVCASVRVRESFSFRLRIMANKVFEWRMKKRRTKVKWHITITCVRLGVHGGAIRCKFLLFLSLSPIIALSFSCSLDRSLRFFLHILLFNKNDSIVCIWRSFVHLCHVCERVCVAARSQRNLVNNKKPSLSAYLSLSMCYSYSRRPFRVHLHSGADQVLCALCDLNSSQPKRK